MPLLQYVRAVRAHWLLVLLIFVLSIFSSAVYTFMQSPTYDAHTQLFVSTSGRDTDISQLNQGGTFTQQRVKSYADIVNSPQVLEPVIRRLRLPYSADELSARIKVETPVDTVLLDITVNDEAP